jgi:AraC family transcriptional regulator, exoenzyme S synthesis regulatory protein ExsA
MMTSTKLELYGHTFAECITLTQNLRLPSVMKDDACFIYIQKGVQEVYAPNQKFIIKDRESILMKCGNYLANLQGISEVNSFQSIIFHLDPEAIKKSFGNREPDFFRVNKARKIDLTAMKVDASQLMDNFMNNMMVYFNEPALVTESLLAVKLQELVLILCDSGNNALGNQIIGSLYTPAEIAFEQIIEANLFNNLTIPEVALLSNNSESTFKRKFKAWYNESPAKYFKRKKLEKAATLLKNSDLQINEIAWDCGFENAAHFSTSFVKAFGKNPSSYKMT